MVVPSDSQRRRRRHCGWWTVEDDDGTQTMGVAAKIGKFCGGEELFLLFLTTPLPFSFELLATA